MWVKTKRGEIVNLDKTYCIGYVKPKDITVAWWTGGNDYLLLSEGDVTLEIAENLQKGRHYMEVH